MNAPDVYVFVPPAQPSLFVHGAAGRFPVRRVLCVGRNYAAHRREMGADDREAPCFFAKPADAVVPGDATGDAGVVPYPLATAMLHHEVELVVALGAGGSNVPVERALDLVFGYAVGVDLTRRDIQNDLKARRHPWEAAKSFDRSAPVSGVWPAPHGVVPAGRLWLKVNGLDRQSAPTDDMLWSVAETLSAASRLWHLAPGDLLFTGTPEGVGPLVVGDRVDCGLDGLGTLTFTVGPCRAD